MAAHRFHMARSQPWPRCEVTLPAPLRSAACCVIALAVEEAAGWSRVAEDPLRLAGPAAAAVGDAAVDVGVDEEAAVLWTASAASVRAATGVLSGRRGSPGRMLGSAGRSPYTHIHCYAPSCKVRADVPQPMTIYLGDAPRNGYHMTFAHNFDPVPI